MGVWFMAKRGRELGINRSSRKQVGRMSRWQKEDATPGQGL